MGYKFVIKALEADFINLEQGTGIVHVAPGHGADDYNLGIKNNNLKTNHINKLNMRNLIGKLPIIKILSRKK